MPKGIGYGKKAKKSKSKMGKTRKPKKRARVRRGSSY
tara:strand:+ start:29 stop:139 length:111 start_codon:yes stop_codon:yes gene_type:complete